MSLWGKSNLKQIKITNIILVLQKKFIRLINQALKTEADRCYWNKKTDNIYHGEKQQASAFSKNLWAMAWYIRDP